MKKTTSSESCDNVAVAIAPQTQKKEGGIPKEANRPIGVIEELNQRIEALEKENRHLRETASQHQGQQQQQEVERFTARGIPSN